ncbi:MAG TPA: hypothetical protein VGD40_11215 [Chryseosolibacter sp.]
MKTLLNKGFGIKMMIAVFVCTLLAAFDTPPGGDSFTIYLNDKLLVKQFVYLKEKTKTISLQEASANDVLKIHYSHCGKMGVARNLTIKDEQNKIVKAWKFDDSSDANTGAMSVNASEVRKIQKSAGSKTLLLVYSSELLPEGIVLANISNSGEVKASIE